MNQGKGLLGESHQLPGIGNVCGRAGGSMMESLTILVHVRQIWNLTLACDQRVVTGGLSDFPIMVLNQS